MRRFAIGDIHGNYKALVQCLDIVDFDFENDELISLGDICDGYPDTHLCVQLLMKIKHLVWIKGNHDIWAQNWMQGFMDMRELEAQSWLDNGGESTRDCYMDNYEMAAEQRRFWIEKPVPYHRIDDIGFVHADVNPLLKFNEHVGYSRNILFWGRDLVKAAEQRPDDTIEYAEGIKVLFVGHTARYNGPIITKSLINLDTGAGWAGRLTIMDIDTKEYWQSRTGPELYPGYKHR
jgi:serine/threonine protein phosphatase 1